MEKFNESLPFDKRMWAEDIRVRTGKTMTSRARCRIQQASVPQIACCVSSLGPAVQTHSA